MTPPSALAFVGLVALIAFERLCELRVARRNAAWSFARGGREYGAEHYPVMVALHTALLLGAPAEVLLTGRPFVPGLAAAMLALALAAQALRWWVIRTLGPRWNTRVIVVPGLPPVTSGPYRYLRHPNYLAVVVEGLALPLVHGALLTAATFTVLNAWLLTVRVRCEDAALSTLPRPGEPAQAEAP